MKLEKDISLQFKIGDYTKTEVIFSKDDLPIQKQGLWIAGEWFPVDKPYWLSLKSGSNNIIERKDNMKVDWTDPGQLVIELYSKVDKNILGKLPFVGKTLDGLLPDARWQYDLWYDISIDESGKLKYEIHFGIMAKEELQDFIIGEYKIF